MDAWNRLLAWDTRLLVRVMRWQRPITIRFLRAVTHLGDGAVWGFVGAVLATIGTEQTLTLAHRLLISAGGAALTAQVIKRLLRRRRPTAAIGFTELVQNPDAFSFPSGHTAAAVATAIAWAGEGRSLGAATGVFSALVAFSRVALGAHFPLDVMAGVVIGLGFGALARAIV
jgi:undecaprenyl-diphosphatase